MQVEELFKMNKDGKELERFISIIDAAKSVGVSRPAISAACRGANRAKYIKGFIWKYA